MAYLIAMDKNRKLDQLKVSPEPEVEFEADFEDDDENDEIATCFCNNVLKDVDFIQYIKTYFDFRDVRIVRENSRLVFTGAYIEGRKEIIENVIQRNRIWVRYPKTNKFYWLGFCALRE